MNNYMKIVKSVLSSMSAVFAYMCVCFISANYAMNAYGSTVMLNSLIAACVITFWFVIFVAGSLYFAGRNDSLEYF